MVERAKKYKNSVAFLAEITMNSEIEATAKNDVLDK